MTDFPLVQVGWIFAVDAERHYTLYETVGERVIAALREQFGGFRWEIRYEQRRRFLAHGQLDPLPLLELGVQAKLRLGWDYAFVVVPNELLARDRPRVLGVPSSALETMVVSLAAVMREEESAEKATALALHLFGHVMGLAHELDTPMHPPEIPADITLHPYTADQVSFIRDRLRDVADSRLEERPVRLSRLAFYWHTLRADPISILQDVRDYRPWRLPFRMGALTATTTATLLIVLLAAESWEIGTQLHPNAVIAGSLFAIVVASMFIFIGQNLGEVSRGIGMREQLVRTRIVVFSTLLCGMVALWLVLFGVSFGVGGVLPRHVLAGWAGAARLGWREIGRQAAFMAMLGVLAGSLGGNLEDEDELKADLFFDEET